MECCDSWDNNVKNIIFTCDLTKPRTVFFGDECWIMYAVAVKKIN